MYITCTCLCFVLEHLRYKTCILTDTIQFSDVSALFCVHHDVGSEEGTGGKWERDVGSVGKLGYSSQTRTGVAMGNCPSFLSLTFLNRLD